MDGLAAIAYAATRMPATMAAARAVFQEQQQRCAVLPVKTLLDLGAGPATTLWAAGAEFPDLTHASLVEPEPAMQDLGHTLLEDTSLSDQVETTWHTNIADLPPSAGAYDLVVMGYLLTELDPDARRDVLDLAWRLCGGAVVVILPGSTQGFQAMLDARQQLLSCGASVVAPCPHTGSCPLPADDWCHFAVRLNRSSLHRRLKDGVLPYEDEKYCYVVATRDSGGRASGRLIRRPESGDRRVTLRVCGVDGIREQTVTRGDRATYRRARKARWGDAWG